MPARTVTMGMGKFLIGVVALALGILGYGYAGAIADPIIRHANIHVAAWPAAQAPVRIALLSDLHIAGPDMPPQRLARIVAGVNAQHPDLILIAGDFVSDKRLATRRYSTAETVEPLRRLTSTLGTFAVLGNHDHWRDAAAFRTALPKVGIRLIDNNAVAAGPLTIIGIDDDFTHHADPARAFAATRELAGPRIVLTHSPDIIPSLPERVALITAGHTHCGQIALPWLGPIATMSRYGKRFACGLINDNGQQIIVGAGLGTSIAPLRIGAPPDYWIVTLGP